MKANTWVAVSASRMEHVDPAADPLINPTPGDAPWRGASGQYGVIDAWGSAVWDDEYMDLWVPIGGGHNNYGGNEPYKISLADATPAWRMMRKPTGAIGNEILLRDGQEDSGIYADGRPRSVHSYNNVAFAPGVGPVIVRLGSTFTGSGNSNKVFRVHPTSGETTLVFDFGAGVSLGFPAGFPSGTGVGSPVNAAACYDSRRNRIYTVGTGRNTWLAYCNPASGPGLWTGGHVGSDPFYAPDGYHGVIYVPTIDRLLMLHNNPVRASLIHPDTGVVLYDLDLSGSFDSSLETSTMYGFTWCAELGCVLIWNQRGNTTQISMLTPQGNGLTSWVRGTLAVSSENTVVPPAMSNNGTFGLFGYSSALRGCYLITSTKEPVHFFAIQ